MKETSVDNLDHIFESMLNETEAMNKVKYLRSSFNYMGNKIESLIHLLPLLPYRNTFCDVFGGTGTVIANREPSPLDVFNDRHGGIAAFYRALHSRPQELYDRIQLLVHSREFFHWCKDTYMEDQDDVIRGAKWFCIAQTSFGGRCTHFGRVTRGEGTIWHKLENLDNFWDLHGRFRTVTIENLSWSQMFDAYDSPETVWYLDPPYFDSNVYEHKMDRAAHREMCEHIFTLDGFVALSGYDNSVYESYPWDSIESWDMASRVAAQQDGTQKYRERTEFLWIKE